MLGINNIYCFIIDHYGISSVWESYIKSIYPSALLLAIDDLANRTHSADFIFDSTRPFDNSFIDYQDLVSPQSQLYLGPYYSLLSPDYSLLHPNVPLRSRLNRVLVFLGGVDSQGFTSTVLKSLLIPELQHLEIDVVVGAGSSDLESIFNIARNLPNVSVHSAFSSLSALMIRADLSVGAAGTTSWERACLGLPSFIIPVAPNQLNNCDTLQNLGAAIKINPDNRNLLVSSLRSEIFKLIHNPDILSRYLIHVFVF